MYKDMEKYGVDSFKIERLESVCSDNADEREDYWITYLGTLHPNGYNLRNGGLCGYKHSKTTKRKIGATTREKWKNPKIAVKMKEGLRNSGLSQKGKLRVERTENQCKYCKKTFIKKITDTKIFCSSSCSLKYHSKLTGKAISEKHSHKHKEMREFIIEWCFNNKEIIRQCPYNSISTTLYELLELIEEKFKIKDMRAICISTCGKSSRKEFLNYLKNIIDK